MGAFSELFQKDKPDTRRGVQKTGELTRILALPRRVLDLDKGVIDGNPIPDLTPLFLTNGGKCSEYPKCPLCYKGAPRLWPTQSAALLEAEKSWGLFSPMGVGAGKCVAGYTEVYDAALGRRRRVDELGTFSTPAETRGKFSVHAAVAAPSGRKECVRLSLKGGSELDLSIDHPVLTPDGYVEVGRLKQGDFVATPRSFPSSRVCPEVSDDEVKLVAYLLADGSTTSAVEFTDDNPEILREVSELTAKLGLKHKGREAHAWDTMSKTCGKATTLALVGVFNIVDRWELRARSKEKRLPAAMYGLPESQIALLLNRFWACDGHVALKHRVLELVLASRGLVNDMRFLLLRLGILSRVVYKLARIGPKTYDAWKLTISGRHDVLRFLSRVGYLKGSEKKCEELEKSIQAVKGNTNVDIVPVGRKELKDICNELWPPGTRGERSRARGFLSATTGQYVGREKFSQFCSAFGYSGKKAWLADSDFLWDRVNTLTSVGDMQVYDVSVPEAGNFVANGIVVHNTLITLLLPDVMQSKAAALLVPSSLRNQLLSRDIAAYGRHFRLPLDRLTIVAYEELSTVAGSQALEKAKPDLIIADECHKLSGQSARRSRFLRFLKENPGTRFCGLSGTVTRRSLRDYAGLCELALHINSPLPSNWSDLNDWSEALDPSKNPLPVGALRVFATPGIDNLLTAVRDGYRRRLVETSGVVATSESWDGASLVVTALRPTVPESVTTVLKDLRKTWQVEDEEIEDPMRLMAVARQIASGFYYRWCWPTGARDTEWLEARAAWHKAARQTLRRSAAGLDSLLLVARAAERGDLGSEGTAAWHGWKRVRERYNPTPPTETVWIDSFVIDAARAWAKAQKVPAIIWYSHSAVEEALAEHFPVYGSGSDAGAATEDLIACSIRAQGTGKNLQRFSRGLVIEPPASGATIEQLFGRMHRPGQLADEVCFDVFVHTLELERAIESAVSDARYVQETQGQRQKLLSARSVGF